ncbi:glucosamine-6-phosphate deaminase [Prevotella aff. ruminicola Tc2-24]|uniref:Glucosamine-6-phosphate deaminase n=1 Tax=Prevotella aff. ruminicola Tc2-24 TaxID=81582 RepID=A0A1I0N651_9BACT|nr:glucosamine-6-phosphate deaminase [Prevotella aff. ruminicola Tc2-24]
MACMYGPSYTNKTEKFFKYQSTIYMNLNLTSQIKMPDHKLRRQVIELCQKVGKPLLKLSTKDYVDNGLGQLVKEFDGQAGLVNIEVFNELQHTITGWPGGKPDVDDTYRPERATPYPKRVIVFSPHPDDDVISMGGTIRRLMQQGHDVHIAYETSGNIAVGDEEVTRFMHFINGFNKIFANGSDEVIKYSYQSVKAFLKQKKEGDLDNETVLRLKGLIRRGEARLACGYNGINSDHIHFLDLPFYESGKIEKLPMSENDVLPIQQLIAEVKPHQIYVAADLADPHGTHKKCTDAVLAAIDEEKKAGAEWLKDCRVWMYRGAWAEWDVADIEMCVPMSPEELREKRNAILRHQSQMESAPFMGNDERLFWQRAEDRNRDTAKRYDDLGLACYEAMEAFVEYHIV